MRIDDPCGLCLHAVAQHSGLGVVVELQALHIVCRGVQVNVVGEVVDVRVHLQAHHVVVPMDAHVQLVALLWVEVGIAAFVAEDVVVDTIGTQLLGDRHAEALASIGLEHPVAYGIVDACRPGETGKTTADVG